jgi:mannose-1-phosphate guanylyltransferase
MRMFAVIMAGGSGTRFWPASRERLPKQFLPITSDCTLFEDTLNRVRLFTNEACIYAVVGSGHAALTQQALGTSAAQMLVEPFGRNTAACIGLAALHIHQRAPDEPIVVLPSDHFVADTTSFAQTVQAAAAVARSGAIVTIGITPTRPETGYGYIEVGAQRDRALDKPYFDVTRFVEKPDLETALQYLTSGRYLWNSGIFVFTAATILAEIAACMPALHEGLRTIEAALGSAAYETVVARVYQQLQAISIDYGVMEKTTRPILVFPGEFGWSDVGSWYALYDLRDTDRDTQANLLHGDTLTIDAKNNLVYSTTKRLVAVLGVEGLAVIDTPEALLVADLQRSQDVKQFTEMLRRQGRTELY